MTLSITERHNKFKLLDSELPFRTTHILYRFFKCTRDFCYCLITRHGRTTCEYVYGLFNGDLPYTINNVRYRNIIMVHNSTGPLENFHIWFITVLFRHDIQTLSRSFERTPRKVRWKLITKRTGYTEGRELTRSHIDLVKARVFNRPVARHIYRIKIQSSTQNG